MGRAQRRAQEKYVKSKLPQDQYEKLVNEINYEYINSEVNKGMNKFKALFAECLLESFKKNGITNSKAKAVLDDVDILMVRKVRKVE